MKRTLVADEPRVVAALASSVLLRALDRAVDLVWRAASTSYTADIACRWMAEWRGRSMTERRTLAGTAIIVAALAHVGAIAIDGAPAGWLWLVPPAAALSVGAVFLLLSRSTE